MNVFDKYVWLLNLLHRRKHLTFQEITNEWFESDLNIRHEELCDRTFRRWCASIETMFHLEIQCNRSTNECSIAYENCYFFLCDLVMLWKGCIFAVERVRRATRQQMGGMETTNTGKDKRVVYDMEAVRK